MSAIDEFFRTAIPVTRETVHAAARRHSIRPHTLYRRLVRAIERGEVSLCPGNRVGPTLYLPVELWDRIVTETRRPGRPRKQ